jgi:hypothetical protein
MRKFIALALLVGAVLVLPTISAAGDAQGPACADVTGGSGSTGGFIADLAAAPCSFGPAGLVTYTFEVYTDATMATQLSTTTSFVLIPSDTPGIGFAVGSDSDGEVCVVLTTSIAKHVIDRAPDTGCTKVLTTISPGFGGFN